MSTDFTSFTIAFIFQPFVFCVCASVAISTVTSTPLPVSHLGVQRSFTTYIPALFRMNSNDNATDVGNCVSEVVPRPSGLYTELSACCLFPTSTPAGQCLVAWLQMKSTSLRNGDDRILSSRSQYTACRRRPTSYLSTPTPTCRG